MHCGELCTESREFERWPWKILNYGYKYIYILNEWEKEKDISGLVFLKATRGQKYLQGRMKKFSIVSQLLLSVTLIGEKINFSEDSESAWA